MDALGTIPLDRTALSEQNPIMGTALDSFVGLTGMPNPTHSLANQGTFTPELESFPMSTTQLEPDSAEAIIPLSLSTASNLASIETTPAADSLTGAAANAALVGDLRTGEYIALVSLGNLPGPDVLDGRTGDGTVGLAPSTDNPYSGTRWKVFEVSDGIVTLENQGANPSEDYQFLDGRTGDGTVGLAPSTDPQYSGTQWRVFNLPDEFRSYNPITEESDENVTPEFLRKVFDISERLDTVPEYLMAVMAFETGGTYSPSVESAGGSGAVGLIQFTEEAAEELGTTAAELASLSAVEQLNFVEQYFSNRIEQYGSLTSLEDTYLAVLFPEAIGQGPDYVLFEEGTTEYEQNRGLDADENGEIVAREATTPVRERLPGAALFSGYRVA
jgi:hypothetical protein